MKPLIHRAQARLEDVRIDLRRGDVGVPEHHLDRADGERNVVLGNCGQMRIRSVSRPKATMAGSDSMAYRS